MEKALINSMYIYIRGFAKFGIKVAWSLQLTLHLKFQKARTKIGETPNVCTFTDRNILEDSYLLVKHFLDFTLREYRIASFN